MPFHEKIAWAALLTIIGGFGAYFSSLIYAASTDTVSLDYFIGLLIVVVVGVVVVMIIATSAIAIMAREDAHANRDERDQMVSNRATSIAYFILLIGVIIAVFSVHLGAGLFWILNAILAVIVVSEAIRYGAKIWQYRQG
ncbi:hypothetical protein [Alterisphingorhabdus coralli]|uniref:DUF2178 domain-containing protein n=1 Tax=Alterisphingorhabdus coralli TaxID=3071408 RepID=A0AA97F5Z6_9SPHN|nr:hypothetical protein [Parasphingorhabdus sp. SCSIO 66989]WOE74846.1 hypothetical protein RB602_13535 [Parasphingorhabdus sp. SCSIO 66989]